MFKKNLFHYFIFQIVPALYFSEELFSARDRFQHALRQLFQQTQAAISDVKLIIFNTFLI